jgi:hypothetical protein
MTRTPASQPICGGDIELNGRKIQCYVLDDSRRVLNTKDLGIALGLTKAQVFEDEILRTDIRNVLTPFLDRHIRSGVIVQSEERLQTIEVAFAFLLCERLMLLSASVPRKQRILQRAQNVTVIFPTLDALQRYVDQACGYDKHLEIQRLLSEVRQQLDRPLALWAEDFPSEFYAEAFRLTDGVYEERSELFLYLVDQLIFKSLPSDVLKEMYDIGMKPHPKPFPFCIVPLQRTLTRVILQMKLSKTWSSFLQQTLPKARPKQYLLTESGSVCYNEENPKLMQKPLPF